uniref:Uncharacterized protein n=1 Tax=Manihot esculenta TaxID=3983 RepID=A0A2C9UEL5_MANES
MWPAIVEQVTFSGSKKLSYSPLMQEKSERCISGLQNTCSVSNQPCHCQNTLHYLGERKRSYRHLHTELREE